MITNKQDAEDRQHKQGIVDSKLFLYCHRLCNNALELVCAMASSIYCSLLRLMPEEDPREHPFLFLLEVLGSISAIGYVLACAVIAFAGVVSAFTLPYGWLMLFASLAASCAGYKNLQLTGNTGTAFVSLLRGVYRHVRIQLGKDTLQDIQAGEYFTYSETVVYASFRGRAYSVVYEKGQPMSMLKQRICLILFIVAILAGITTGGLMDAGALIALKATFPTAWAAAIPIIAKILMFLSMASPVMFFHERFKDAVGKLEIVCYYLRDLAYLLWGMLWGEYDAQTRRQYMNEMGLTWRNFYKGLFLLVLGAALAWGIVSLYALGHSEVVTWLHDVADTFAQKTIDIISRICYWATVVADSNFTCLTGLQLTSIVLHRLTVISDDFQQRYKASLGRSLINLRDGRTCLFAWWTLIKTCVKAVFTATIVNAAMMGCVSAFGADAVEQSTTTPQTDISTQDPNPNTDDQQTPTPRRSSFQNILTVLCTAGVSVVAFAYDEASGQEKDALEAKHQAQADSVRAKPLLNGAGERIDMRAKDKRSKCCSCFSWLGQRTSSDAIAGHVVGVGDPDGIQVHSMGGAASVGGLRGVPTF